MNDIFFGKLQENVSLRPNNLEESKQPKSPKHRFKEESPSKQPIDASTEDEPTQVRPTKLTSLSMERQKRK